MLRRPVATETHEDFSEPILPGKGASDYERYLRTDDLLALQKTPEERSHPDELLFQTVHQSSELWLKLGTSEVARATAHVRAGSCIHLPARLVHCIENTGPGELRVLGVFRPAGSPAEAYYPDGTRARY